MDDVRDDVNIARPFEIDTGIFVVWHKYLDATFFIASCILLLTVLVIYMAHQYRRTRVRVGLRKTAFHDSSDVPHNTEECFISLCSFVVEDQLASH